MNMKFIGIVFILVTMTTFGTCIPTKFHGDIQTIRKLKSLILLRGRKQVQLMLEHTVCLYLRLLCKATFYTQRRETQKFNDLGKYVAFFEQIYMIFSLNFNLLLLYFSLKLRKKKVKKVISINLLLTTVKVIKKTRKFRNQK